MITLRKLYRTLTKRFNLKLQEKWDQCGIKRYSSWDKTINKVIVCLDCNLQVVDEAIKGKYDVIISHHPIFTKSKNISTSSIDLQILKKLNRHKIDLISLHTCVDNNEFGLNHYLVKMLSLHNLTYVKNSKGSYYIGHFSKPFKFDDVLHVIYQTFKTLNIRYIQNTSTINSIILCSGSGFSVLKPDLETFSKNSLIVTGDIKWHDWNLVNDLKINTLDIGHDVEKYFNDLICDYLEDTLDELSVKKIYPKIKILTLNYDSNL